MKRKLQRMVMMPNLTMKGLNNMIGTECQMILNLRNTQNISICYGVLEFSLSPLSNYDAAL